MPYAYSNLCAAARGEESAMQEESYAAVPQSHRNPVSLHRPRLMPAASYMQ
jgi:hypothetical protein